MAIATAGVTLCTLLPFLPGPYDPLALPLSMMARVAGFVGHALDLLQFPPEQLARARGFYGVHDVPHTRWKYFWFD